MEHTSVALSLRVVAKVVMMWFVVITDLQNEGNKLLGPLPARDDFNFKPLISGHLQWKSYPTLLYINVGKSMTKKLILISQNKIN